MKQIEMLNGKLQMGGNNVGSNYNTIEYSPKRNDMLIKETNSPGGSRDQYRSALK